MYKKRLFKTESILCLEVLEKYFIKTNLAANLTNADCAKVILFVSVSALNAAAGLPQSWGNKVFNLLKAASTLDFKFQYKPDFASSVLHHSFIAARFAVLKWVRGILDE